VRGNGGKGRPYGSVKTVVVVIASRDLERRGGGWSALVRPNRHVLCIGCVKGVRNVMPAEHYTVKINRREGMVEITGNDKDWIAKQIEALRVVYQPQPDQHADVDPPTIPTSDEGEGFVTGGGSEPIRGGEASKPATRPRKKGGGYRGTRNPDLVAKLTADVQQKLATYQDERKSHWNEATDQAAIVAKFLKDECQMDGVTADDIYTVFDVLGWRGPNPRNALQNARYRKGYFSNQGGKYTLTLTGERFAQHDAKVADS
jgi:hypothetical protein